MNNINGIVVNIGRGNITTGNITIGDITKTINLLSDTKDINIER